MFVGAAPPAGATVEEEVAPLAEALAELPPTETVVDAVAFPGIIAELLGPVSGDWQACAPSVVAGVYVSLLDARAALQMFSDAWPTSAIKSASCLSNIITKASSRFSLTDQFRGTA